MTFSQAVWVTNIALASVNIATPTPTWRGATLHAGSGTRELRFRYTVAAADMDANGVSVSVHALAHGGAPANGIVTEGSSAVFTLKRTGDTAAALTVTVEISAAGSVLAGSAPSQATFAAESAQTSLSVATDNDARAEADGQVTARLSAGSGYTVAEGAGSARVDVLDNDRSGVTHTVIWSADMTVLDYQTGAIGAASADLFANTESTEGLEALELWYFTPTAKLRLKLNESLDDVSGLTLDIGDLGLALAEESEGSPSFTWSDIDVEWSDGDTVAVRLTRTSQAEAPSVVSRSPTRKRRKRPERCSTSASPSMRRKAPRCRCATQPPTGPQPRARTT